MSHDDTVKGGTPCQPPDAAATADYNSSGMPSSGVLREDYPTLKRDHDQMTAVNVPGEPNSMTGRTAFPNLTYVRLLLARLT